MMKVLFTWELGSNYGHLAQQLPVARELRRRGHEVLFAVCDARAAQAILAPEGILFVQAPAPRMQQSRPADSAVYAEMLARSGFGELEALRACAMAWRHLFALFRPDVMVADHAPLSLFAARLVALPALHLAIGFELPPAAATLPVLREWLHPDTADTVDLERAIVGHMNTICLEHTRPPFERLADLYASDVSLLATFPELDHFPERAGGRFIGPLLSWNDGMEEKWPDGAGPKVFVYLRPDPCLVRVLEDLRTRQARVLAVIPGLDSGAVSQYSSTAMRIHPHPIKLQNLLEHADLIVTYGGHGMIACGLLAGIPMLVIPTNIEQMLLARRIEHLGAGIGMGRDRVEARFAAACDKLLTQPQFRDVAQAVAAKYKTHDQDNVVRRIANTVERLPAAQRARAAAAAASRRPQPHSERTAGARSAMPT